MKEMICRNPIKVMNKMAELRSKKERVFIHFEDCAKNFSAERGAKFSKCVATRDVTTLTFTFYTKPRIKVVFKQCSFLNLVIGRSAASNFFNLQQAIVKAGYSTYDLS